jgi:photosystem II stability/assembly factor-like uncharacterized protein
MADLMLAVHARARTSTAALLSLVLTVLVSPVRAGAAGPAEPDATWEQQVPLPASTSLEGVDMISPTEGWAVGHGNTTIMHTTDGGATWTLQDPRTSETLWAVRFLDAAHGWAVGNVMLYTTDGGITWTRGNFVGGTNYAVDFVDASRGWTAGNGGTTFRTTDGGRNWDWVNVGTSDNLFGIDFVNASTGWAVGADGTIVRTTNGGLNWSFQSSGTNAWLQDVEFVSPTEGWAAGEDVMLHTTDGGPRGGSSRFPPASAPTA